jgi:hypothetical protein
MISQDHELNATFIYQLFRTTLEQDEIDNPEYKEIFDSLSNYCTLLDEYNIKISLKQLKLSYDILKNILKKNLLNQKNPQILIRYKDDIQRIKSFFQNLLTENEKKLREIEEFISMLELSKYKTGQLHKQSYIMYHYRLSL